MLLTPSNWEDIKRYYLQTFIKLEGYGDKLFYIEVVNPEEIITKDKDGKEFVITLHEEAPFSIDFSMPHRTMYQLGQYAFCLSRIPAKQYHRGISSYNTMIKVLTTEGWGSQNVNFTNMEGYVSKQAFKNLKEAILVTNRNKSEALSPRFAVQVSSGDLWCDYKKVGRVDKKSKCIYVNPLIQLELSNILNASGMSKEFQFK